MIAILREHEPELKAAGIVRLAVFGSVARGDNSPASDVDLLAEFDSAKLHTLLTLGRIENQLADLLGTSVDLSSPTWLKESILTEAIIKPEGDSPGAYPQIDQKAYRGMGNILRHSYHRVEDGIVWDTVKQDLPALKETVKEFLSAFPPAQVDIE